MSDRQGVEIDYCPKCRGVWLDRGELDKIIERTSDHYTSTPEKNIYPEKPLGSDYYNKEHGYRHKKKKGFLGDFFDFD